ncbi:TetR/AcrR family transcriptional regulator [Sanguibacter antarcticus]|uniref:TetR family transcriptional regulator n=1 Tax=Sanguibacter antarcticus TaxID=372484 RepID=A0A2A9E6Q6_9MICO|nr:TetR/AcrR family transcriptional regulator [Sanguibacter antarcticus]PFG33889.1 TetR family transcriptional regulator [Sanguibacter antarcticus]
MNAPRTARDRARAEVMAELVSAARARLDTEGAAALSLRAVARDLGMASSAVYRYVDSRDALLTLLVIEGYDAVGAVCEDTAARARAHGADAAQTWLEVARGVRAWAIANPRIFELVYGTPVPGYEAPQETVDSATRIWQVLLTTVRGAIADGSLQSPGPDFDTTGLLADDTLAFLGTTAGTDPEDRRALEVATLRSFTLFSSLVGAISTELFGHLHKVVTDYARTFDVTIATAAAGVGLFIDLD